MMDNMCVGRVSGYSPRGTADPGLAPAPTGNLKTYQTLHNGFKLGSLFLIV